MFAGSAGGKLSVDRTGPLTGVSIVEMAGLGPAQLGGMLLADLGAEVIRIDRTAAVSTEHRPQRSLEILARGRRSIALDLKSGTAVDLALRLIDRADILLDPYRPGVMERLGLGPGIAMERNQRLIYARMTGWGQTGPLAHAAGHDINYIALAGALHPIGPPDEPPPVPLNLVGDFGGGGMLLAMGTAAALYERSRSGQGQVLDVAMIDGVASLMTSIHQLHAMGDWSDQRGHHWLQGAAPWYRAYETADRRFVTVGSLEPKFYELLLTRLGFEPGDWPQWDETLWPELTVRFQELFASRTLAQWRLDLEGSDVCFAPALGLDEATRHPHLAARGTYVEHDGVTQPAPVPRFARTPGAIASSPPLAGEHTLEILTELGVSAEASDRLRRDHAVAWPEAPVR